MIDGTNIGAELAGERSTVYWLGKIASGADNCLNKVSQPDSQTPGWEDLDPGGREQFAVDFHYFYDLVASIGNYTVGEPWRTQLLPGPIESRLRVMLESYINGLPFAGLELTASLAGAYHGLIQDERYEPATPRPRTPLIVALRKHQSDALVAGRMKPFTGAGLIDRWWDWRRGAGEYAESSSYAGTQESLRELHEFMGGPWVDLDWESVLGEE